MKRTWSLFLGAVAAAAVFTGCTTTTASYEAENNSNFALLGTGVKNSIASSGIQETRLQDGRLQVAANIQNREGRRIQVQVQCAFKDAQGFAIDTTPWNTLILTEHGQETVTFTSMNNQAQRYTISVREAH